MDEFIHRRKNLSGQPNTLVDPAGRSLSRFRAIQVAFNLRHNFSTRSTKALLFSNKIPPQHQVATSITYSYYTRIILQRSSIISNCNSQIPRISRPLLSTLAFVEPSTVTSGAASFATVKRWIHRVRRCAGLIAIATDNQRRKIHGSTARHNDAAAFLMSNDQPDDDAANDTDLSTDKQILLQNLGGKRSCVEAVTSGHKASIEQRTRDEAGVKRSLADQKGSDDESRVSGDICRICHMGSFSTVDENRASYERQTQPIRGVDSQTSTLSSYAYLGPLISACKCRGTVALVHVECLERWLTESGHSRCELCGYKYATKRVPRHNIIRSVVIWFNTVIVTRQMLLDILYLVVTTPLALFSCYICVLALRMLLKRGLQEMPWMIVAMLPTCSLTLIAYWGWIITLARLHGRRWRRYWRNNFVIRLVPDDSIIAETNSRQERTTGNQLYHQRVYEDNETIEIRDVTSIDRSE